MRDGSTAIDGLRAAGPHVGTGRTANQQKCGTRQPWELIVIDNGSTDGTGTYLAGVQDAAAVPVTVISNTTNLVSRRRSIRD